MTSQNFDVAFKYLLGDEGTKYTNDPHDSGGPTKFGITKKTYEEFFNKENVPDSEIEFMTEWTAKQIYWAMFWIRLGCERVSNPAVTIPIFDSATLYGVGTVALITQHTLSLCGATLKFDGIIGDKSVVFLNAVAGGSFVQTFYGLIMERIETVVLKHPKDEKYRHGWTLRAERLLRFSDPSFVEKLLKGEN